MLTVKYSDARGGLINNIRLDREYTYIMFLWAYDTRVHKGISGPIQQVRV